MTFDRKLFGLAAGLAAGALANAQLALAEDHDADEALRVKHVLLLSIDGMHAVDLQNCLKEKTCPNIAALAGHGVHYTRASATRPSDSFPGLMGIVTGGTPRLVGAYYDVAYDRVLAPPQTVTGNGLNGGSCIPNQPNGTSTEYEEGVDINQNLLNGGYKSYGTYDGGTASIDPAKLPRDPYAGCKPVYPWNFIRANTVFGVIHEAGGYTAWADKHPIYAAVSGPTGTDKPSNLDDFYGPEINSTPIALPVHTADGFDCRKLDISVGDYTLDFNDVKCYDQLKVNAVLNWIDGKTHLGNRNAPVPAIFGMNFQAVSVGQKLIENGVKGGYLDAAATPSDPLAGEIRFVDAAVGQMVAALKQKHRFDDTAIIITAKHGQSPIDPNRFFPIPGQSGTGGTPPSGVLGSDFLPDSELNQVGPTEDDVSLLWLKPGASVKAAVSLLETNASKAGIGEILYGPYVATIFDKPGLPSDGGDPRTPDIVITPNVGVVYTGSTKKQAEHGGFALDDTNVLLLVSNPALESKRWTTGVETTQVAPTILKLLGHEPWKLEAVRKEGTAVLPGI